MRGHRQRLAAVWAVGPARAGSAPAHRSRAGRVMAGAVLAGAAVAVAAVGPVAPAFGASSGGLAVVRATRTPTGVEAVAVVPLALSGMRVPTSDWSASVAGHRLPLTATRLVGANLQVTLVLEQAPAVLAAEQGAAAEFLHQFPATTHAGVAVGHQVEGASRDAALAALGRLSAHGDLTSSLAAADDLPPVGVRSAIVVFARCSSLTRLAGSLPVDLPTRELSVVGTGSGCGSLSSAVAARAGLLSTGHVSGPGLTAASDLIANRLLGEYELRITASRAVARSSIALSIAHAGDHLTTHVPAVSSPPSPPGSAEPTGPPVASSPGESASGPSTPGPSAVAASGGDDGSSGAGANAVRGVGVAVVLLAGAAMFWARRRPDQGRHAAH